MKWPNRESSSILYKAQSRSPTPESGRGATHVSGTGNDYRRKSSRLSKCASGSKPLHVELRPVESAQPCPRRWAATERIQIKIGIQNAVPPFSLHWERCVAFLATTRAGWPGILWSYRPDRGLCLVKWPRIWPRPGVGRVWTWVRVSFHPVGGGIVEQERWRYLLCAAAFPSCWRALQAAIVWVVNGNKNGTVFASGSPIQFHFVPFTSTYLEGPKHRETTMALVGQGRTSDAGRRAFATQNIRMGRRAGVGGTRFFDASAMECNIVQPVKRLRIHGSRPQALRGKCFQNVLNGHNSVRFFSS